MSIYSAFSSSNIFPFINSWLLSDGKFQTMLLDNLKPSLESPYLGESSSYATLKLKNQTGNFRTSPEILADLPGFFRFWMQSSSLCTVTIILEVSPSCGLWSCGTPSLTRNFRESFLQCRMEKRERLEEGRKKEEECKEEEKEEGQSGRKEEELGERDE